MRELDRGGPEVGEDLDPLHAGLQRVVAHLEEDDAQAVHVHLLGVVRGAAALADLRGDVERRPDLAGQAVVRGGGVGVAIVRRHRLGYGDVVQGGLIWGILHEKLFFKSYFDPSLRFVVRFSTLGK